jgi:hypothetical protein
MFLNAPTQGLHALSQGARNNVFYFSFLGIKILANFSKKNSKKSSNFIKKNPKSYQFLC